jgi:hypothetical protein
MATRATAAAVFVRAHVINRGNVRGVADDCSTGLRASSHSKAGGQNDQYDHKKELLHEKPPDK